MYLWFFSISVERIDFQNAINVLELYYFYFNISPFIIIIIMFISMAFRIHRSSCAVWCWCNEIDFASSFCLAERFLVSKYTQSLL